MRGCERVCEGVRECEDVQCKCEEVRQECEMV